MLTHSIVFHFVLHSTSSPNDTVLFFTSTVLLFFLSTQHYNHNHNLFSPSISATMKTHPQPKQLKTQLFSCSFFRHCVQTVLSPTGATLPLSPPPPPHRFFKPDQCESSASSSSSQSFTQWRFSLPNTNNTLTPTPPIQKQPDPVPNLEELFHISDLRLSSGPEPDQTAALHLLERSLVPNLPQHQPPCPPNLMRHLISNLRSSTGAKPSTKILFALCLSESNRRVAVEAGAAGAVVESVTELDGAPTERALAALELMCTVAEGAEEVRAHALAVPVMVTMMGKTGARGKEYAIGVLAVIYGGVTAGEQTAPPEEVARAVNLALQGECSARGRRKGEQLLKTLQQLSENEAEDAN